MGRWLKYVPKNTPTIIWSCITLVLIVALLCAGYKVGQLQSKIDLIERAFPSAEFAANAGGYDVLVLGNSISTHKICDFWWQESGMAATEAKYDWVHLLQPELEKRTEVNIHVEGFSDWETLATDRAEVVDRIVPYLFEDVDLVIIQLGENISNATTFESDFEYLIDTIEKNARMLKL